MTAIPLLVLLHSARAGCDQPTDNTAVSAALDEAMAAYSSLDIPGFRQAFMGAQAAVPCLGEALTEQTVARLHRTAGLLAVEERDPELSKLAFAAARFVDADYAFPSDLIPEGNPILVHYGAVDLTAVENAEVPAPADGSVWLDGRVSDTRRVGLPVYFQRQEADGSFALSTYLAPGTALPSYPKPSDPAAARWRGTPFLVVSGAALVGSAVFAGLAANGRSQMCAEKWSDGNCARAADAYADRDAWNRKVTSVQAFNGANIGLAVVSAGFGAFALTRGRE